MLGDLKMEVNAGINQDFAGVNQNFQYQDYNNPGQMQQKSIIYFSKKQILTIISIDEHKSYN